MWFLGKRETVNAWKKADFDGFRDKEDDSEIKRNRSEVSSKWNKCKGSVGPLPLDGASNLTLKWQRFCLIIVDR